MELELYRHDLLQSATCARGTLAVMPMGEEKKPQKLAIGDLTGVVQCVGVRKGELVTAFKTLPAHDAKVTSLSLGKGKQQRDRIFVAAGNTIKGISKKGKEFFKFNTQITETIKKVDVHEKLIWSSAEFVHNQFVEGKDKAFYLAPDRINDAEVVPVLSQHDWCAALACQDRQIRLLSGEQVMYEVSTTSAPTCLRHIPDAHDPHNMHPNAKELLYGTDAGNVVQLMLETGVARQGFALPNPKKLGAINAIYSGLDLSKSGCNDIVVGREDGSLEVYDLDDTGSLQQIFSARLNESICSLDGGCVTNATTPEVVLHTFSGKVLTYAPPGGGLLLPEGDKRLKGVTSETEQRRVAYEAQVQSLRAELAELQDQLDKEKRGFADRAGNTALLAAAAPFTVQDRCKLEADEACYVLTLESSVPIFTVALQASIPLQLLDVTSNVAILSKSAPDPGNGNLTLATYRCQDATCRLSIKFKVREGSSGSLQAFVIPSITPKTCVTVSHKIKPLCLHQRTPEVDNERPTNELLITGSFSLSDMHLWVSGVLPELPTQLPGGSDQEAVFSFRNTLLGTQLVARYRAGEARFTSDLITSLGVLHDHIMREATAAGVRASVAFSPSSAALQHSIAAVWPQLDAQRTLKAQVELLEGLLELRMQDPDVGSYLTPEQRKILDNSESLREAFKTQPQHLDHLTDLVKDLYQDFCKLAGITAPRSRLPALEQLLTNTSTTLQQVMDFMLNKA